MDRNSVGPGTVDARQQRVAVVGQLECPLAPIGDLFASVDQAARLQARHDAARRPTASARSARPGRQSSASRCRRRHTARPAERKPSPSSASWAAKPTTRSRHRARPIAIRSDSRRGFCISSRAASTAGLRSASVPWLLTCVHHCTRLGLFAARAANVNGRVIRIRLPGPGIAVRWHGPGAGRSFARRRGGLASKPTPVLGERSLAAVFRAARKSSSI